MGNPFTSPSVSNYNTNPPADDGSVSEANRVKWSTQKSKLTDPLKTCLETLVTNTNAAFGKVIGGAGVTSASDDYEVQSTDQGKLVRVTVADKTVTSPDATSVASPFVFGLVNGSDGDITFAGSGSQTIDGNDTLTIPKTRGIMVFTDGSNWFTAGLGWHPELRPLPFSTPRGRLTLTTAVPVLNSDVSAAETVYFTPYQGNTIMLPDANGDWAIYEFSELSQALDDDTKSPSAAGSSSLYDIFVWDDDGTLTLSRGPAWSSATSRGTGAGTTQLGLVDGVLTNAVAISNGPGASRGVYVGTIATDGSTQLNMQMLPSSAAGGTANRLDVWNMYNRVDVAAVCRDSTDSWTYSTATIRSANNSTSNRITLVRGLNDDAVDAKYNAIGTFSGTGSSLSSGIGLDSTSAFAAGSTPGFDVVGSSVKGAALALYGDLPGLGQHYLQALESAPTGVATVTWYGDAGSATTIQSALMLRTRM